MTKRNLNNSAANSPAAIKAAALSIHQEIVRWRRDLHRIPEIGFDLPLTSRYIREQLDRMGLPYQPCAGTGIVALIRGSSPGPTVALRADMDGLAIREETDLPFASGNGNMHACGHDAHMAMVLGAAKIIATYQDRFKGNIKLLFQPAEEGEGGAEPMICEGCLENPKVDAILGLHIGQLFPELGSGQIGIAYGPVLAAASVFSIRVKGESAHVATPGAGVDAIITASEIVLALHRVIPREMNLAAPATISVTRFNSGGALNATAAEAVIEGDFRTVDREDERLIKQKLSEVCRAIAGANGARVKVGFIKDFPATINDQNVTRQLVQSAGRIIPQEEIIEIKSPSMGNDDFSCFLQKVPGTYFFLGSPHRYPHHHPRFDIEERYLWLGSAVLAQAALDLCSSKK